MLAALASYLCNDRRLKRRLPSFEHAMPPTSSARWLKPIDYAAIAARVSMPKRASVRLAARAASDEKQEATPTTLSGERAETIERTLAERQRAIDVLNTAESAYDARLWTRVCARTRQSDQRDNARRQRERAWLRRNVQPTSRRERAAGRRAYPEAGD